MATKSATEWCTTPLEAAELLSHGDGIRAGTYELHSRFTDALNFTDGSRMVSLVSAKVGAGPANIVLRRLGLGEASTLEIGRGFAGAGGLRVELEPGKTYVSRVAFEAADAPLFERNLAVLERILPAVSPAKSLAFLLHEGAPAPLARPFELEFQRRMRAASGMIFGGDLAAGIRLMKGAGWGFTPSGDDFLCGMLTGLNAAQGLYGKDLGELIEHVYARSLGQNPASNTFLSCAKEGMHFEKMRNLLLALGKGHAARVEASARDLARVGETSGADSAAGLALTMRKGGRPWF
ncbi:MAG: DUF2877 domain-containing protein [Pseudomonadota bacterium]